MKNEAAVAIVHQAIAYQYGLLDPINWDQDCHEQLWLMNRLWNSLVEIEHKHRARYREIVGCDDAVVPLQSRMDALRAEQNELRAERKRRRKAARARVATLEIDERLRELGTHHVPIVAAQLKSVRADARIRTREQVQALNSEHFEAVKAARQNSGLYWGNYNAVCASYDAARSKAMKENAELRFRRFTGEGRFTVQIINGASVDEILTGRKQVSIDPLPKPVPDRAGKPRPRLNITVYTKDREPRLLTFPLIYDRPLPENCRVQQVVVTRRRVGTRWRYAVVFTCRVERPVVSSAVDRVIGINLGFRQGSDGGLRIATLFDGQAIEHIRLSRSWMEAMDDVETIRHKRDLALNDIHTALKASWHEAPEQMPAAFGERLTNLVRAPKFSPASLAWVVLRWRGESPGWWPDMLDRLERWRRADKHDYEIEANKREHLMLARREQYRLNARKTCAQAGVVRIGKIELRKMALLETPDGAENELHQRARRNRQRASLYLLQQEIKLQAEKFGCRVEAVDGPVTITCHRCGARCAVTTDLIHVCEHCSAVWDQDENAARNIFAAPRERSNGDGNARERSQVQNQPVRRSERYDAGERRRG